MSLHLMHINFHPTNCTLPAHTYRTISTLADIAIRGDKTLDPDYRAEPAQINVLHNVLISDDEPFTTDRQAVERFAAVLESDAFRLAASTELAELAGEMAQGLRALAADHETLNLTLV